MSSPCQAAARTLHDLDCSIAQFHLVADPDPASMMIGRHQYRERRPLRGDQLQERLHDRKVPLSGDRMRMGREAPRHGGGNVELDVTDAQTAADPTLFLQASIPSTAMFERKRFSVR